ncbi:DUF4349 domain-containing protein [Leptospira semungkisensis]|uniref:DUF4349 domain-containing protein n=1 Tax=Leptospira semungkisensis TaxID=2484985 RepID=A0A4V3JCN2_9LEPT|nr:DUF4349 domain-containing protein [Leptospira semungkisensis]TGK06799.1 DUF4349 domain-containing protein [Leptospira semungkisensis]
MFRTLLCILSIVFLQCSSAYKEQSPFSPKQVEADSDKVTEQRIVIYDASIDIEVGDPESASKQILELALKYEGYTLISGNKFVKIRVASKYFQTAISDIESLGTTSFKQVEGKDVTEEFTDSKIRLENKLKARERYLELLKKAENVDSTLKVEKELERLNGEIESYKGKIERLSHLAKFSTISVRLQKKQILGPLGYIFWVIGKGLKLLFIIE